VPASACLPAGSCLRHDHQNWPRAQIIFKMTVGFSVLITEERTTKTPRYHPLQQSLTPSPVPVITFRRSCSRSSGNLERLSLTPARSGGLLLGGRHEETVNP
jgi:hypothetical protein